MPPNLAGLALPYPHELSRERVKMCHGYIRLPSMAHVIPICLAESDHRTKGEKHVKNGSVRFSSTTSRGRECSSRTERNDPGNELADANYKERSNHAIRPSKMGLKKERAAAPAYAFNVADKRMGQLSLVNIKVMGGKTKITVTLRAGNVF